jgi:DNA polymerase III delta prime subunit
LALQCRDSGITRAETEALPYPEVCLQGQDVYSRAEWLATVKSAYDRTPRDPANIGAPLQEDGKQAPLLLETPQESQPPERPRFFLRDAAYALQPQPPIDYIVDDLMTNSSVNVIYGEPGSKKTYTALSLAVCVANGKNWLDFKTRKNPVLIIDEESGEKRLSRRLGEAIRGESGDPTSPIFYVSLAGFKLDDPNDPILIHALIEQSGARLVIIDALADIMDGDENDKKDVQPVFNALRKIAENTDSAILVIHHSNKAGGYRGSSAIKGSIDLMIQVTSENGSNLVNFNTEKNRDGDKTTWAAEAIWAEDQFYLKPTTRQINEHSLAEAYIINFLTDNGASYVDGMMDSADICSPQRARQAVYSLARKGIIIRTNKGTRRRAIYELSAPVSVT